MVPSAFYCANFAVSKLCSHAQVHMCDMEKEQCLCCVVLTLRLE